MTKTSNWSSWSDKSDKGSKEETRPVDSDTRGEVREHPGGSSAAMGECASVAADLSTPDSDVEKEERNSSFHVSTLQKGR